MNPCKNLHSLDVDLKSAITQKTCGQIVIEIMKYIIYQKLQIPFPYERLKFVVNSKRKLQNEAVREPLNSSSHFRKVSVALDNLDYIFKSLLHQMECPIPPEEVCVAFGASPVFFKEVYRIKLPSFFHKDQCQNNERASGQSVGMSVLRRIATSGELEPMIMDQLSLTNMFVFIKKQKEDTNLCETIFNRWSGCKVPRKSKVAVIDFKIANQSCECCDEFSVFSDESECSALFKSMDINECTDNYFEFNNVERNTWFQSSVILKGFKDCVVNGRSVTDSWIS